MITLHNFLDLYKQITDAIISTAAIYVILKNFKGNDPSQKKSYNKLKYNQIYSFCNYRYTSTL